MGVNIYVIYYIHWIYYPLDILSTIDHLFQWGRSPNVPSKKRGRTDPGNILTLLSWSEMKIP